MFFFCGFWPFASIRMWGPGGAGGSRGLYTLLWSFAGDMFFAHCMRLCSVPYQYLCIEATIGSHRYIMKYLNTQIVTAYTHSLLHAGYHMLLARITLQSCFYHHGLQNIMLQVAIASAHCVARAKKIILYKIYVCTRNRCLQQHTSHR